MRARALFVLALLLVGTPSVTQGLPETSFAIEEVDIVRSTFGASLARDKSGNTWLAYSDASASGLRLARRTDCSGWRVEVVDGGAQLYGPLSMKLDSAGNPHICYNVFQHLRYAHLTTNGWMIESPDTNGYAGRFSLSLDRGDSPHIIYYASGLNDTIKYAYKLAGSWVHEVASTSPIDPSIYPPAIALDYLDRPHICFAGAGFPTSLAYKVRTGPTAWTGGGGDEQGGAGRECTIAIDQNGVPHITHDVGQELWYATPSDLEPFPFSHPFGIGRIDQGPQAGASSIAFDALGILHVSYFSQGDLWFASKNPSATWEKERVDAGGDMSSGTSLVVDSRGNPAISYFEQTTHALKYASVVSERLCDLATTEAKTYASISFPLTLSDSSLSATLIAQLGGQDDKSWRLAHWDPMAGAYSYAAGALSFLQKGLGYWLITRDPKTIRTTGIPEANDVYAIPLTGPGWYQLGNPYLGDVPKSSISVRSDVSGTEWAITDSTNALLTYPNAWVWNHGYSDQATTVPGYSAFWVKKIDSTPGQIRIPRPLGILSPSLTGTPSPGMSGKSPVSSASQEIRLTARQGQAASNALVLGIAPVKDGEWNSMAVPLPPSPPGRVLRLAIPKRNWGPRSDDYASEYQPAAHQVSWDFTLSGGEVPGGISLELSTNGVGAGQGIQLSDRRTGERWNLDREIPISIAATGTPRQLRITLGPGSPDDTVSQAEATFRVYPNPARGSAGLLLQAAKPSDAHVWVYDVRGRLVRELIGRGLPQGENVLVWDGRDRAGRPSAAGLYLARCQLGAQSTTLRIILIR